MEWDADKPQTQFLLREFRERRCQMQHEIETNFLKQIKVEIDQKWLLIATEYFHKYIL